MITFAALNASTICWLPAEVHWVVSEVSLPLLETCVTKSAISQKYYSRFGSIMINGQIHYELLTF